MLVDMTGTLASVEKYYLNLKFFPQIVKCTGSCKTDFSRMVVLNYTIPCILKVDHSTDTRKNKISLKLKSFGVNNLSSSKI